MALWIPQHFDLPTGQCISLRHNGVAISPIDPVEGVVLFIPTSRELANAQAIALKKAAQRLEEIGKGLR
jgi:hypothetical protein